MQLEVCRFYRITFFCAKERCWLLIRQAAWELSFVCSTTDQHTNHTHTPKKAVSNSFIILFYLCPNGTNVQSLTIKAAHHPNATSHSPSQMRDHNVSDISAKILINVLVMCYYCSWWLVDFLIGGCFFLSRSVALKLTSVDLNLSQYYRLSHLNFASHLTQPTMPIHS